MTRLPFLLEQLCLLAIVVFFVTQVAVPLWRGVALFPMFSSRRRTLEREIARANEARDIAAMKHRLKSLKKRNLLDE